MRAIRQSLRAQSPIPFPMEAFAASGRMDIMERTAAYSPASGSGRYPRSGFRGGSGSPSSSSVVGIT